MGATAFAAATLAVSAYGAYKGSQRPEQADPSALLATAPTAAQDAARAAYAGSKAAIEQKRRTAPLARSSNILTSPQGIPNAPAPGQKTLVGQ